jgi:hypothetical protein
MIFFGKKETYMKNGENCERAKQELSNGIWFA